MAISSQQITDRVHLITLSGVLTWAEFQAFLAQTEARDSFASGQVRILIWLDHFAGWEAGEQWSDVSFFFKLDYQGFFPFTSLDKPSWMRLN